MTVLINASNTSGLTITSDTSGNLAFQSNGTTVATISGSGANAGIQMGSAFAPAFSAYLSTDTNIPNNTNTKVAFNTEEFDTNSNYDNATNYRFTPTIAGYYQIDSTIGIDMNTSTQCNTGIFLYKNGSIFKRGNFVSNNTNGYRLSVLSTLVYANGSTDYFEIYVYQDSGSGKNVVGSSQITFFQGFLARSA